MFDYERLDVYQCALQYVALAFKIIDELPRGHSTVADQMRRATISIPLNIAEAGAVFRCFTRIVFGAWPRTRWHSDS